MLQVLQLLRIDNEDFSDEYYDDTYQAALFQQVSLQRRFPYRVHENMGCMPMQAVQELAERLRPAITDCRIILGFLFNTLPQRQSYSLGGSELNR